MLIAQWITPSGYRSEDCKCDSWIVSVLQATCFSFSFKVFEAQHGKLSLQSWIPYQLSVQIPHFHLLSIGLGLCSSKYLFKVKVKQRSGTQESLLLHASHLNPNRMTHYSERQRILWKKCDCIIKGFRINIKEQGRSDISQTEVAHTGLI